MTTRSDRERELSVDEASAALSRAFQRVAAGRDRMVDGFDKGKIASLAAAINTQLAEVANLRERYGKLGSELNGAEVRLANLRIELTRAVDGQLDMTTLKQCAPHPIESRS